jgi:hypothetical protein
MAAGRGGLGWVILAAALAVPGFLLFNSWSRLKTERDHSVSQNARKRAEGGVFETSPAAGRLVNPIASTAAPAGAPPGAAPAKTPAAPGAALAAAGAPSGAAPPGAAQPMPPPAPAASAPDAAAMAVSSMTTVVLPRDPMLSPLDLVRIQEAALEEEERKQRLLEEARHKNDPVRRPAKPKLKPIETRIELQGIVAKPDGYNLAIVNGSTVNPGDRFTVEGYPGKVSILKISSSEVTMQYQGRKFRMSVNAE